MDFGANLERHRRLKGWSQAQLAAESGLPLRSIQNWEQGHRAPRLEAVANLAKALGVKADILISDEGPGFYEHDGIYFCVCHRCRRASPVYGTLGGNLTKGEVIFKLKEVRRWTGKGQRWVCPVCRARLLCAVAKRNGDVILTVPEDLSAELWNHFFRNKMGLSLERDRDNTTVIIRFGSAETPERVNDVLGQWTGWPFTREKAEGNTT
jgi:DNA-binding XRE family transcriptional regulator